MPEQVPVVKVIARSTQMHHTKAVWDETYSGFVLLPGEIGLELNNNEEGKVVGLKIGNGSAYWEDIPYFGLLSGSGTDSIMQAVLDPEKVNIVRGDYSSAFGTRNLIDTNASESSAFGGIINIYSENSFGAGYRVFIFRNQNFAGGYVIGSNAKESIIWGNTINIDCTPVYESNKIKRFIQNSEQEQRESDDLSKYLAVFGEGHNIGYKVLRSFFSGYKLSVGYDCKYLTLSGDQHSVGNHCSWLTMFGGNGNAVDSYTNDTTIVGFANKVYHSSWISSTVLDKIFMIGHNIATYNCVDVYSIGHHNEFYTSISKYYETPKSDIYCIGSNNSLTDADKIYCLGSNNYFSSGNPNDTFEHIYNIGHNNDISTCRTNVYMFGYGLTPTKDIQWIIGKYNSTANTALFVIGNGDNDSSRRSPYLFYDNKYTVSGSTVRSPELGIGDLWLSDTYISTEGMDFNPSRHGSYVWDFGKSNNFANNNSNPYIHHSTLFCFGCKIGNHVAYINVFGGDSNNIGDYTVDSTIFGYHNTIPAGTDNNSKNSDIYMFGNYLTAGRRDKQWLFGHDNAIDSNAILLVGSGTHNDREEVTGVNVFVVYQDHVYFPTYTTVGDFGATTKFVNDNYLGINAKAVDSDKLNGQAASYYAKASDIPTAYIKDASVSGNTLTLTKQDGTTIITFTPSFTDTNYYHTSGSWNGLTYTAAANGGAPTLAFTLPTGTGADQVAVGNHNHDSTYSGINHTHSNATSGAAGFMSADDKTKLDSCVVLNDHKYYLKDENNRQVSIADIITHITTCFRGDTSYVTMYDGTTKLISEVKAGDSVLGYDVNKQEYCEAIVLDNIKTGESTEFDCYVFEDGSTIDIYGADSFMTHHMSCFDGSAEDKTDCFSACGIDYLYSRSREHKDYLRKVIKSTGGKNDGVAVVYKRKFNCAAPVGRYCIDTSNGTCLTKYYRTFGSKVDAVFAGIIARYSEGVDDLIPDDHIEDVTSAELFKEWNSNKAIITIKKEFLNNTDYKAMKYAEGALSEEDWLPIKELRIAARAEINRMEERNAEIVPLLKETNPHFMSEYGDKYAWVYRNRKEMLDFADLNNMLEDVREYMNSSNNQ